MSCMSQVSSISPSSSSRTTGKRPKLGENQVVVLEVEEDEDVSPGQGHSSTCCSGSCHSPHCHSLDHELHQEEEDVQFVGHVQFEDHEADAGQEEEEDGHMLSEEKVHALGGCRGCSNESPSVSTSGCGGATDCWATGLSEAGSTS